MRCRWFLIFIFFLAYGEAHAQVMHRNIFSGRQTYWTKGDSNVTVDEKDHRVDGQHSRSAPDAEYLKLDCKPLNGKADREYAHYVYATPHAIVNDQLAASLWVKAYRPGIQLKARVVLPNEPDPANPAAKLTVTILGDTTKETHKWDRLTLTNPVKELAAKKVILGTTLGREVNTEGAYVDQLILNVYPGPGVTELWIDDLDIGPVVANTLNPKPSVAATTTARENKKGTGTVNVEFSDGQILINNKPVLMRAIRYTDTPMPVLREAMFNTIWFPADATPEKIDEAIRNGFYVVPTLPLVTPYNPQQAISTDPANMEREASRLAEYFSKFASRDWVLMWDLGSARTAEQVNAVRRTADLLREYDSRRPRSADVWDGHKAYATTLDAVGAHRWPLFTSLELDKHKDFLTQRRTLTGPGKLSWTWVQTHSPEWLTASVAGSPTPVSLDSPLGPHPEQIRILTYLAIASGYRGLGFWSDRYLAKSHHGQARLLQLSILNAELEMLEPVLLTAREQSQWVDTNHPFVKAAIIKGEKHILVLPVWLGPGSQYCPDLSAVGGLKIRIPAVPTGADPWRLTPAGVKPLQAESVPGGTEVTIPDFDLTAAVVFTADLQSMLVRWQDHTRHVRGAQAATWALNLAVEEYNAALKVHEKLAAVAPAIPKAEEYFKESGRRFKQAEKYRDNGQFDHAYDEALRATQPIRLLMREHWNKAVEKLDTPTASPYAVSYFTLPQHYDLAQVVQKLKPSANVLPHGGFELNTEPTAAGADVTSLPGWTVRADALDKVAPKAMLVSSAKLSDPPPPTPVVLNVGRFIPEKPMVAPTPPTPTLGRSCLKLEIKPLRDKDETGKPIPLPLALERAVVVVNSPSVNLPAGTLVGVSFWVKVPKKIQATSDGLLIFDDASGEPLSVRTQHQPTWKQYYLYRRVPPTGTINLTIALTGIGEAYVDDVRIEPLVAVKK